MEHDTRIALHLFFLKICKPPPPCLHDICISEEKSSRKSLVKELVKSFEAGKLMQYSYFLYFFPISGYKQNVKGDTM